MGHKKNFGEFIFEGFVRTTKGISSEKATCKATLVCPNEAFNSDRPYYCQIKYKDDTGVEWEKKIFANDPFSAFELAVRFINGIISFHEGFNFPTKEEH